MQGSRLLASLPAREMDQLRGDLERVRLDAERALIHAHAPVRRVFFPESGLVALSVTMADGRTAGVTIVGSEGIVGVAAALGETGVMDAAVLVPGIAQAVSVETAQGLLKVDRSLSTALFKLAPSFDAQATAYVRAQIAYAQGDRQQARVGREAAELSRMPEQGERGAADHVPRRVAAAVEQEEHLHRDLVVRAWNLARRGLHHARDQVVARPCPPLRDEAQRLGAGYSG